VPWRGGAGPAQRRLALSLPGTTVGGAIEPSPASEAAIIDDFADSPMPLDQLIERAMMLAHRLAGLAAVYLIDDPAIMAMMFC